MSAIENIIYRAIIETCEDKERNGQYLGNGHHLAQLLSVKVSEGMLAEHRKRIYDAMTGTPTPCAEIATKCGIDSRNVSSQLRAMERNTTLVLHKMKGKRNLWFKSNP